MSDLYLDEIEKIKYYKERIIAQYLKNGIPIDKKRIQSILDNIDLKIAVFSQSYIQSGTTLDPDKFNEQKKDIYRDLAILYKTLFILIHKKIETTEKRIHFVLQDLKTKAQKFQYLVDDLAVVVYGKTIFHQTSGFQQRYENGRVVISLAPIQAASGSYLACLFQCNEIDPAQVTFFLNDEISGSAYQYDKQYIKIIGNYKLYTQKYPNSDIMFGQETIAVDNKPVETNRYNLFLNVNKFKVQELDSGRIQYVIKTPDMHYKTTTYSEISFYVYGATYLAIDTAGTIRYQNYTGNRIDMPKQRQKIVIRAEASSVIDIKTDGILYADMTSAYIQDNGLKITNTYQDIEDYTVETIDYGDAITFPNPKIIINNANNTLYDIDYIAIKQAQISELEDQ